MQNDNKTKLSCLPVSLYPEVYSGKLSVTEWSQKAKNIGLDYIDINALFLNGMSEEEIKNVRSFLAVPVMMISAYSDFSNPTKDIRENALNTAMNDIKNCALIGGKYIRLTAGQHHKDVDEKIMLKYIYECFEKCVPEADKYGVTILLENHSKPGAWEYPDYVFNSKRYLDTLKVLSDLPIKINFDTANAFALDDWKSLLYASAEKMATVHLNDLSAVSPLTFSLVGEGIVPLKEMLNEVFKTGFDGEISIEEASFLGWGGIYKAVENTKELLK